MGVKADKKAWKHKVWLYALIDPRTNDVRYVGKSQNPRARFTQYKNGAGCSSGSLADWLAELRGLKLEPIMQVFCQVVCFTNNSMLDSQIFRDSERSAIRYFDKASKGDLLNHDHAEQSIAKRKRAVA